MNTQDILNAINASPAMVALAQAKNWTALASALSAAIAPRVVSRIITARGIASAYSAGPIAAEALLMKLEGAAAQMLASSDVQTKVIGSLLSRQLGFLKAEGLDFGDATLRAMLDTFAAAPLSIITSDEAARLKALALQPETVTPQDCEAAWLLQPVSTWTGAVTSREMRDGMVHLTITYTSSVQGAVPREERTFGDDLTPGRVADIIAKRCASLQSADAALAQFAA